MITKTINTLDAILDVVFGAIKTLVTYAFLVTVAGSLFFTATILMGYTLVK